MGRIVISLGTVMLVLAAFSFRALAQDSPGDPYEQYKPTYSSPYWGYTSDPYGSYLSGAADVIRAQSEFLIGYQQAALVKQRVREAKIENRRKELEQWLWERDNLPTPEDERQRSQREQLRRSRNDPPLTEIWSAKALNDLLADLEKSQPASRERSAALSQQVLAKINVTSGKRNGNIGLLKEGRVTWPLLLHREVFDRDRQRVNELIRKVVAAAAAGEKDAKALEELIQRVMELRQKLVFMVRTAGDEATFTPTMYMDAKNFLHQFEDALRVLQEPDAADYLNGKYTAQGQTVAELARYMIENGLRFAPATPGSETAYTTLHRALAAYDNAAGSETDKAKP